MKAKKKKAPAKVLGLTQLPSSLAFQREASAHRSRQVPAKRRGDQPWKLNKTGYCLDF